MVWAQNNFNGGPAGTDITTANSGQDGDVPFDVIGSNSSVGNIVQFASVDANSLNRPTAEYVMKHQRGTDTVTSYSACLWSTTVGVLPEVWARFYVYFTEVTTPLHTDNSLELCAFNLSSGFPTGIAMALANKNTTTAYIALTNLKTGAFAQATTVPVSINEWLRIEVHCIFANGPNSSAEAYLYAGDDVDTTTYSDSISMTGENTGQSAAEAFSIGQGNAMQINSGPAYFSNWVVTDEGFPGPAPFRAGKGVPGILTNPIAIHMM